MVLSIEVESFANQFFPQCGAHSSHTHYFCHIGFSNIIISEPDIAFFSTTIYCYFTEKEIL